jgi:hypothetical protein
MTSFKKFYRKPPASFRLLFLAFWLATALACADKHVAQQPPPPPAKQASTQAAGEGARATPPQTESKLSAKDAEELFHSVEEILQFSSKDTALPIKHEVKPRLTSRDEVVAYLQKNMAEDKDAQRLRRSELVLKKFGLLPRDFNLGDFLVQLLREQVAGYYDPKTKAVNLLDWVDIEQQRPVMAHELTHALQDQSFGLEKWMKAGAGDLVENSKEPTAEDIDNDEINTARQAVVEGQAMAVMVDYMLAPTGQSLLDSPRIVEALKAGMLVGTADSVQFRNAPLFLKEALTFPYRYGLDFETMLLVKGGKEKAFAGVFQNPPHSTRQIMEPEAYLSGEQLEPLPVPDFKQVFKNYERFDIGAVGEFDVAVLIDQYAGAAASRELYPHWRGGYYYAVRPKGDPTAPLGLLYVSRWSNAERSAEFGAIYAKSLLKRYLPVRDVNDGGKDAAADLNFLETLVGSHTWLTEEGLVVIEVKGDTMLVTESLDQTVTDKLEQEIFQPAAATK